MKEKMAIEIGYTEDGLFGPDEDNREGVDMVASFKSYEEKLEAALLAVFPDAEIKIENGIQDKHTVTPEDYENPDYTVEVGEIIHQVWETWDWVVIKQDDDAAVKSTCVSCDKVFKFDSETCFEGDDGDLCAECTTEWKADLERDAMIDRKLYG